jgi:hypothetical protein
MLTLKVTKVTMCEILDRSDFHNFYTIKSVWEDDFGVKIEKCLKKFGDSFGAAKFLTRMLILILRSAFPSKHAEHTHQRLMRTMGLRARS